MRIEVGDFGGKETVVRITPTGVEINGVVIASTDALATDAPTITGVIDRGNDVLLMQGAGVPVDYTDGDPAATGEGVAGPGSQYTDYTNANLYINGGTAAEPVWKLVTRAA